MHIDIKQLEINVNLHAFRTDFLNLELHYVLATSEQQFRFASFDEQPQENERRFYCFLVDKELHIPAGNMALKQSYVLQEEPAYAVVSKAEDFFPIIDCIEDNCASKAVRNFPDEAIEDIHRALEQKYGQAEKHLVKSPEFQHLLLVLPGAEVSISATMVYFKQKLQLTEQHYERLKEEKAEQA